MTHPIPFYGTTQQCWDVFYSEYRRLSEALGRAPFEFKIPNHAIIHEYIPKDGDEIVIDFCDTNKKSQLVVEAEIVSDEDAQYTIFVHPQSDPFVEPLKSIMSIWRQVKKALQKTGTKPARTKTRKRKQKRGPHGGTQVAMEQLMKMYIEAWENNRPIPPRKEAAKKVGITVNTWRRNYLLLWNHWETPGYEESK